jgi:hypothetical protein
MVAQQLSRQFSDTDGCGADGTDVLTGTTITGVKAVNPLFAGTGLDRFWLSATGEIADLLDN